MLHPSGDLGVQPLRDVVPQPHGDVTEEGHVAEVVPLEPVRKTRRVPDAAPAVGAAEERRAGEEGRVGRESSPARVRGAVGTRTDGSRRAVEGRASEGRRRARVRRRRSRRVLRRQGWRALRPFSRHRGRGEDRRLLLSRRVRLLGTVIGAFPVLVDAWLPRAPPSRGVAHGRERRLSAVEVGHGLVERVGGWCGTRLRSLVVRTVAELLLRRLSVRVGRGRGGGRRTPRRRFGAARVSGTILARVGGVRGVRVGGGVAGEGRRGWEWRRRRVPRVGR